MHRGREEIQSIAFIFLNSFSPEIPPGYTQKSTNGHKPQAGFVPAGTEELSSCHLAGGQAEFVRTPAIIDQIRPQQLFSNNIKSSALLLTLPLGNVSKFQAVVTKVNASCWSLT